MDIKLRKILDKVYAGEMKSDEAQWEITKLMNNNFTRRDYGKIDYEKIYEKIESAFHMGTLHLCPDCGEIAEIDIQPMNKRGQYPFLYLCNNCGWNNESKFCKQKSVKDSVTEILVDNF